MADSPSLGKIRCFDPGQRCGLVAGISGSTYFFRPNGHEDGSSPFAPGQLVTFRATSERPIATDVEPVAAVPGAAERPAELLAVA